MEQTIQIGAVALIYNEKNELYEQTYNHQTAESIIRYNCGYKAIAVADDIGLPFEKAQEYYDGIVECRIDCFGA